MFCAILIVEKQFLLGFYLSLDMLTTAKQTQKYAVLEMMMSVNLLHVANMVRNRTISEFLFYPP